MENQLTDTVADAKLGSPLCLRGLVVYRAMEARILLLLLFTIYDIV